MWMRARSRPRSRLPTGGNFESLAVKPGCGPPPASLTNRRHHHGQPDGHPQRGSKAAASVYPPPEQRCAISCLCHAIQRSRRISIAAGTSSGSVSVLAPSDDVYLDAGSVSATIAAATGGNFENLAVNPVAATTADHRYARHHDGQPDGEPERGRGRQHRLYGQPQQRSPVARHGHALQWQRHHDCRRRIVRNDECRGHERRRVSGCRFRFRPPLLLPTGQL